MSKNSNKQGNQTAPEKTTSAKPTEPALNPLQQAVGELTGGEPVVPAAAPIAPVDPAAAAADVVVKDLTGEEKKEPEVPVITQGLQSEAPVTPAPVAVAAADMTTDKGTATTQIIVQRIQAHMDFLNSRVRLDTQKERDQEQVTFMESVGNSLKQEYEQYALVTDALLEAIRGNQKIFSDRQAFRFMDHMERSYPADSIKFYQRYMDFLTSVAKHWKRRKDLAKFIDVTFVIEGYPAKARENITKYFNNLTAV